VEAELRGGMGASGEIHVYDDTGEDVTAKIQIDGATRFGQA